MTEDISKQHQQSTEESYYGISDFQTYLFNEGSNFQSYKLLGSHLIKVEQNGESITGWRFAVWAPNAKAVSLVGDFNEWEPSVHKLYKLKTSGIWVGFFTDIPQDVPYKYAVESRTGEIVLKADPFARYAELRPNTASITYHEKDYKWKDKAWIEKRQKTLPYQEPMLIYEVHAGSWKTHEDGSTYTYLDLAQHLIPYVKKMGYTHIELMPLTEYPYDGSWGYQVTGFFAATSRYGTPEDLKFFIDSCHKNKIGVIMDWVPAHFPRDAHGLATFDGTHLYEYADPRMGEHKEWGTLVFDYGKSEVISFLLSSAYFWAEEFHVDGFRVDAVSSMLYRDYNRKNGEWLPNKYGKHENLEAISFLQTLNKIMFAQFPNILMIAEESTSWGLVTAPAHDGGLGFNYKWNMGWMNDTLKYMSMDPLFRKPNHSLLTFLMHYAYSENFILPLSHDEVVHGKRSLVDKMSGNYEEKFASFRALLGYYMSVPGKKLLFMGGEFAQFIEWRYDEALEWHLLEIDSHKKFHRFVQELNHFYLENKAFWQIEDSWNGFSWINSQDSDNSILSYIRKGQGKNDLIICVSNFTPVPRADYVIGVPTAGEYEVVFHSDAKRYGGSTHITKKSYVAKKVASDSFPYSISIKVAGLSIIYLKKKLGAEKKLQKSKKEKSIQAVEKITKKSTKKKQTSVPVAEETTA